MTGDQGQGFVTFNNDLSVQLYLPSRGIEPKPGTDEVLDGIEASLTELQRLLQELEQLTRDEDTEPEAATSESKRVGQVLDALHPPFEGASLGLKKLSDRFPDTSRGTDVLTTIERISDGALAIHQRAKRAITHHARVKRERDNKVALDKLSGQAKQQFSDHYGETYDTKLKVGNELQTWTVGSIEQSLDHLAKTGRLAELADALFELFVQHDKPKQSSQFHKDFFGMLGGKDRLDKLIAAALHNVAHPEKIFQGDQNTCAAAVLEMLIAMQEPATYLRMVMQVASGKAELVLRDATKIQPTGRPGHDDGSLRNPASQLVQPALMEVMRPNEGYDAKKDRYTASTGKEDTGVTDDNLMHGSSKVLAEPLTTDGKQYGPEISKPRVGTARLSGKSHQIIVIETDAKFAYIINPQWGRPERIALDEWKKLEVQLFTSAAKSDPLAQFRDLLRTDRSTWKIITASDMFS